MTVPGKTIELLTSEMSAPESDAHRVVSRSLREAERLNDTLNSFLQIDREGALRRAEEIDDDGGQPSPQVSPAGAGMRGIPVAVKDNICVRGMQATCGSRILAGYHPPYDATVIERLKNAGAVIIGKTNCDEFAMGSSNENSAYGPVRNPWDTERVPGGSSGGSAAAVASRVVPAALGSETGGSVRQPAALCGIVGFKPTYGRVSRSGVIAFASSLDQIGPLARDVRDAATLLQIIAGPDPLDSTTQPAFPPDYQAALTVDLQGLRVGVPREYWSGGMDPAVEQAVRAAI